MSDESVGLDFTIREKVAEAVAGTDWAPPDGGVITNVVVIIEWLADGEDDQSLSWYRTGSRYQAEGAARAMLRSLTDTAGRHGDDETV